ncbi:hypothetical protein N1851_009619 [Merluccius polli]|uniref:Uncharacterized protein n=1 Tax=Merluccius polli TaxID=89951 RepID=A0AA47N0V0_MERPO|nr:hypothetical protein N1851_009619 [Merluccius polli]
MLKLIQTSDSDGDVGIVHTGKRRIKLAAEQANAGAQFRGQDLLLVPSEEPALPESVIVEQGLITIPNDRTGYVQIPIANTNKQDITLNQRTVLGQLQTFKTTYAVKTEQNNLAILLAHSGRPAAHVDRPTSDDDKVPKKRKKKKHRRRGGRAVQPRGAQKSCSACGRAGAGKLSERVRLPVRRTRSPTMPPPRSPGCHADTNKEKRGKSRRERETRLAHRREIAQMDRQ